MPSILITNGRVIDPAADRDERADVLIVDGIIAEVGKVKSSADETIDATGMIVAPGLIDMHVHLREPGNAAAETIASGAAAAIAGGFTTIVAMPNTNPPADTAPAVEFVYLRGVLAEAARVLPIGTITRGRKGKDLAEFGTLAESGAVGFSDDGDGVADAEVMRRAMEYAAMLDAPILAHAEDGHLSAGGVMHEGAVSARLGLPGIPSASESTMVARDVALAELTGVHLHVQHVSARETVEIIREAKARGVSVTAEVTAHHLVLSDDALLARDEAGVVRADGHPMLRYDTNLKMNPPLRTRADMLALREALADGTIDCIVSDHAPHTLETKTGDFREAPFGIIGLETTLAVLVTELVETGVLDWADLIAAMTMNPARVLRLPAGTLAEGADADVTIIDPAAEWTVDASAFRSKSRNTPFDGKPAKGRAVCVIVGGDIKSNLL